MKSFPARIRWVFLPGLISYHACSVVEKIAESEITLCPICYGIESAPDVPNKIQTEKAVITSTMSRLADVLTVVARPEPEDKLVVSDDQRMIVLMGWNDSLVYMEVT